MLPLTHTLYGIRPRTELKRASAPRYRRRPWSTRAWMCRYAVVDVPLPSRKTYGPVYLLCLLALLRQVCSHPQQTRAFCARSPPSQAIAEQAPSRGGGRVVLEREIESIPAVSRLMGQAAA